MPNKVGIIIALDGEKDFANGMKSAEESAKKFDQQLKNLEDEYKGNANSLEALTKKQELLKQKQDAANRALESAKGGLANAKKNYRDAGEALEKFGDELEEARKELQRMDDAGEKGTAVYKKQAKAVEDLEKKVNKQAQEQAKASINIDRWETKVAKADGSVKKMNTAVDKNAKYVKEASTSADKCATSIDKMGNEMQEATGEAEKMSSGIKDALSVAVGNLMSQGFDMLVDGAKQAAEYVVEVGSRFEASMSKVEALSGATGAELEALSDKAKELGSSTQYSASEVADAFGYMSLAGWDTQSMLQGIDGVLNLAAASQMDLATASDMVTDYLSAFGLSASDASHMVDMLAYAQANSNTTTQQLGDAFGNCAANMNAAGQDMETTTAILEAFANQGIKGSEAGTKLSAIMRDITAKMKDGKIQIGDTAVAVTDANGNFRDLTDILLDVEAATDGMGTAEQSAALSATFTSRSVGGLNMILAEGVGNIAAYEQALRNSDGAAADMAATMQDNLGGKVTSFKSALEGLGIYIYNQIATPLGNAVDVVTRVIQGITKALSEEKDESLQLMDEIQKASDELKSALEHAADTAVAGEVEARHIETLGQQLIALNGIEEMSAGQKIRLKQVVDELGQSIPELSAAYDEETGKVNLSNEAIQRLTQSKAEEARQTALLAASQEAMNALVKAEAELEVARGKFENVQNRVNFYQEYKAALEEASDALATMKSQFQGDELEAAMQSTVDGLKSILNAALESGAITAEEYNQIIADTLANGKWDEVGWQNYADKMGQSLREVGDNAEVTEEQINDLEKSVEEGQEEYNRYVEAADKVTQGQKDVGESSEEAGRQISGQVEDLGDLAGAAKKAADSEEELEEAQKRAAEAAKAAEEAHDKAAESITKAYEEIKKSVEDAFKVDAFGEWGANAENGIQKFSESMQQHADAMTKYKDNLAAVKEAAGSEGAAFVQYLEQMGESGSQLVAELAEHPDQIKTVMEQWAQAMDVSSEITSAQAANELATKLSMERMSATIADYPELDAAVQALGLKATNSTRKAFEEAVETAAQMGVEIPEGLAEGITENSAHPEEAMQAALDQLNAAIQGQGEAVISACEGLGIEVPQSVSEGIAQGGDAAVQAYDQLISMLAGKAPEFSQATQEAGSEAAAGMESTSGEMSEAAQTVVQAAVDSMGTTIQAFRPVGELAGGGIVNGLNSRSGDISDKAQEVVENAKTNADTTAQSFSDVGTTAGSQFATGLNDQRGAAVSAGQSVALGAKGAAAAYEGSFYSIGSFMGQGISQGIMSQAHNIANAAANVVRQALAAARAAGAISSPARKFRDMVGKEIGAGVAWGIKQSTNLATDAAEELIGQTVAAMSGKLKGASSSEVTYAWQQTANSFIEKAFGVSKTTTSGSGKNQQTVAKDTETYYNDVYKAAQTYMSRVKSLYDVSEKDELAYWKKVQARLKVGTAAWYQATDQVNKLTASIAKEAEDNAKKAKEAAEEAAAAERQMYADIVSAADDYLEHQNITHTTSIKRELAYWKAIRNTLKAGTQAYDDATKKIVALESKIGTIGNAEGILDTYKTYYEVSEAAEVEYWDIVRKQYAAGTQERIDADKHYFEAKKNLNDKLKALEDDYRDKVKEVNDELERGIQELTDKYNSAVQQRAEAIYGAFGWQDEFKSESVTGKQLVFNAESQAAGYAFWRDELNDLESRQILSDRVIAELREKGPQETATVVALNSLSDEDLQKFQDAQDKKWEIALEQSKKENEGLKKETEEAIKKLNEHAAEETKKLTDSYTENRKSLEKSLDGGLKGLATNIKTISEDEVRLLATALGGVLKDQDGRTSTGAYVSQGAITAASGAGTTGLSHNGNAKHDAGVEILESGSNRRNTLKDNESNYSPLFQHIVTNYGVQPNQAMYHALGAALGVPTSETVTGSEMAQILTAMNKNGLRRGTKYLDDAFAWMDEAGIGSELIIRKKDGAILNTAVQKGDAIIPEDLTENLYRWGSYNPDIVIPQVMSAARMNALAEAGYRSVGGATGSNAGTFDQMLSLMIQFMPYLAEKTQVTLDGRGLVDYTSQEMAKRSRRVRG